MSTLVDGLSVLAQADHRLTACACWQVQFDRYTHRPRIVVPFDTCLDQVEAVARRALWEHNVQHWDKREDEAHREHLAREVAITRLICIERLADVHLWPGIG